MKNDYTNSSSNSLDQFHALFENMIDGSALHELMYNEKGIPTDYIILDANPSFEKQLGIVKESIVGKASCEAYGVSEPPYFDIYKDVVLKGKPQVFETYYPPLDKYFSISAYATHKTGFATIFEDITNRKKTETELKEKEVQYRNLADSGLALIWKSGTDMLCNYFNQTWFRFTGRTLEQEKGNGWAEGVHPDDFEKCLKTYVEAFNKREVFTMEYRLRHVSGKYRWVMDKGTPNYNSDGEFIGFIGHCFDITELKNAEYDIIQKNIELQKLNNEKDKFFSIIAHDLKSPFNSILGLSEILIEQVKEKDYEGIEKYSGIILKSSHSAMELLMNLMEWTRAQTGRMEFNPEYLELVYIIDDIEILFSEIAKQKSITLIKSLPLHAIIFADKAMINTVLRNMISNAIKFTEHGGKVTVAVQEVQNEMIVSVSDTGIGIKKSTIEKLFHIDETHSTPGTDNEKGTGLGLILCKEFVEKHGGKIYVESEPEKGSSFYFTIPK